MRDEAAALQAGLKPVNRDTCLPCHEKAHGKPFDYDEAVKKIAHPLKQETPVTEVRYKNPLRLALHPHRPELYVTCEAAHTVIVIDTTRWEKVAEIAVGGHPTGVTFHPSGQWAYVTNRLDDTVSVIDTVQRQVRLALSRWAMNRTAIRTDAAGKQTVRREYFDGRHLGARRGIAPGNQTAGSQPQPVVVGVVSRRQAIPGHQHAAAVRPVPNAADGGSDDD